MLRLLSANLYDLEENSRMERLVDFKLAYKASIEAMDRILEKQYPEMSKGERRILLITLYEFMQALAPGAKVVECRRLSSGVTEEELKKWSDSIL